MKVDLFSNPPIATALPLRAILEVQILLMVSGVLTTIEASMAFEDSSSRLLSDETSVSPPLGYLTGGNELQPSTSIYSKLKSSSSVDPSASNECEDLRLRLADITFNAIHIHCAAVE